MAHPKTILAIHYAEMFAGKIRKVIILKVVLLEVNIFFSLKGRDLRFLCLKVSSSWHQNPELVLIFISGAVASREQTCLDRVLVVWQMKKLDLLILLQYSIFFYGFVLLALY